MSIVKIPSRTFIVGAGVSAECGAPTLADFLQPKYIDSVTKQWLVDLNRLTSVVYTKSASPNIEMILSIVDYALARKENIADLGQDDLMMIRSSILNIITEILIQADFNLRKQLGLDACFSDPYVDLGKKCKSFDREVLNPTDPLCKLQFDDPTRDISGVASGYRDTYFKLVRCLNSGEHIISLNYDLFLDYALESQEFYYRNTTDEESPLRASPTYGVKCHGLPEVLAVSEGKHWVRTLGGFSVKQSDPDLKIGVLKIHGALNLGVCSSCKEPIMTGVLPVSSAMSYLAKLPYNLSACCSDCAPRMLIVPPSWSKDYTSHVLEDISRAAIKAISCSDEIVFLGYSFAESDYQIRYMFNRGLAYRRGRPWDKVVVVDPLVERTSITYEKFFGKIEARKEKASDYIRTLDTRWL